LGIEMIETGIARLLKRWMKRACSDY